MEKLSNVIRQVHALIEVLLKITIKKIIPPFSDPTSLIMVCSENSSVLLDVIPPQSEAGQFLKERAVHTAFAEMAIANVKSQGKQIAEVLNVLNS